MMKTSTKVDLRRALCAALVLAAASLSACTDKTKDKKPGQALASVNGAEVTVLQLNEEMQRAGVPVGQQDAAGKQLLQVLIDRTLLEEAAATEKIDRDPKVMQAVDRARALIVAQAYLQKRIGNVAHPSAAEVEDYFNKHPSFFSNRKQFSMDELVIGGNTVTPDVRAAADQAKSLEEVAVWLDAHKVKFGRSQITRSTADVPEALSSKLLDTPKGQIFVVKESQRAMFIAVTDVREAQISLSVATPQIEQFLMTQKNKEFAAAELQRLRAGAKIDYLNKAMAPDASLAMPSAGSSPSGAVAGAAAPAGAKAANAASADDKAALDRGVAGLK